MKIIISMIDLLFVIKSMKKEKISSSQLEKVTGGFRQNAGSGGRASCFGNRHNPGTPSGSSGIARATMVMEGIPL